MVRLALFLTMYLNYDNATSAEYGDSLETNKSNQICNMGLFLRITPLKFNPLNTVNRKHVWNQLF